jgi:hypothetical protein
MGLITCRASTAGYGSPKELVWPPCAVTYQLIVAFHLLLTRYTYIKNERNPSFIPLLGSKFKTGCHDVRTGIDEYNMSHGPSNRIDNRNIIYIYVWIKSILRD